MSATYDPPGPPREAYAAYYVRHLVQHVLDRAFKLDEDEPAGRLSKRESGVPDEAPRSRRRPGPATARTRSRSLS